MRIGLVCHSSLGGSGVIATELGQALAKRGHEVHFFCAEPPPRLDLGAAKLHLVKSPPHALFPGGDYTLALASKLAGLAPQLDVLHAHYAIPHATSAFLARQLSTRFPKVVVTLHGTDVLTLGADPAFHPVVRHSLAAADALTVPTRYLRDEVQRVFSLPSEVLGNFVDTARFRPGAGAGRKTLLHNSNFRPLKRVEDAVRVLAEVRKRVPDADLVLVGDGPTRAGVEALARELGVLGAVRFLGEQRDVVPALQSAAVFLFPSETESFGLAALEALACGVPVVASRTGGLPELIDDGKTGFLAAVGDVAAMADAAVRLLTDGALSSRVSAAAREAAESRWQTGPRVDPYEALYRRLL